MRALILILVLSSFALVDPPTAERRLVAPAGSSDGLRGNSSLQAGDLEEAARRYEAGIDRAEGDVRARLLSNRGLLHLEKEEFAQARAVFEAAYAGATSGTERARAAYNAGTAAAAEEDLEAAADHFRKALLADPGYDDARHNLEVVKRLLKEQESPEEAEEEGDPDQQESGDEENEEQEPDDEDSDNEQDQSQEPDEDEGRQPEPDSDGDQQDPGPADDGEGDQPDQPGGEQPGPEGAMSPEDAERILRAIEDEEAEVLRDIQRRRTGNQSHERDW